MTDPPNAAPNALCSEDDHDDLFDDLGRRAGAALRHPPPAGGVQQIAHRAHRNRAVATSVAGAAVIALVVGGMVALGDRDRDAVPPSATSLPLAPTPSTTPAPAPTTAAVPTTVSIPPTSAPIDTAGPGTSEATAIHRWESPSPITMAVAVHAGGPPALLVLTDDGRAVRTIDWFGDISSGRHVFEAGEIRPVDALGDPVTIESLHSGMFLGLGITPDGALVKIDPWSPSATVWPHPGVVTDVSMTAVDPYSWALSFWAIGYDTIDGLIRPVLWFDDGISDPGGQGPVAGTPIATQIATFEAAPTNPNPPLVVAYEADRALLLIPEADGMSRLWTVRRSGDAVRTELRFDAPNRLDVAYPDLVWVSDATGVHLVTDPESADESTLVWPTPARHVRYTNGGIVLLDAAGAFVDIRNAGGATILHRDEAATDYEYCGSHVVCVLHPDTDEVVAVESAAFQFGGTD